MTEWKVRTLLPDPSYAKLFVIPITGEVKKSHFEDDCLAFLEALKLPRKNEELETLPIRIEMHRVHNSQSGLMWATMTTGLFDKASGFEYPNSFIVQVCSVDEFLTAETIA
ncbi:hypothetical protein M7I_7028 [Glarea lozoyensis 74030]|uniref:Uncharacterized protein n=1 Tax=Glarea lozoyensis (strain ATCC 74030 / MF5533) TaxID=1104152 RepID=H0EW67_GLAL7|nr:hypothetical protein M7I_7028 [Glarea lozoyensis 74030]